MRKISSIALMSAAMALGLAPAIGIQSKPVNVAPGPQLRRRRRKARHPLQTLLRGGSHLNRSQHWAYAKTYREARALSPYPNRPVR